MRNESKLIGNVYVFCDSLSQLLETINDEAPILNTKGEKKGVLRYSLVPKTHDRMGNEHSLMDYEDVNELIGQTISVRFELIGVKGLPDQYCTEVYANYKWIDE